MISEQKNNQEQKIQLKIIDNHREKYSLPAALDILMG